eukprot:4219611-Prymnesium_polylepis.1
MFSAEQVEHRRVRPVVSPAPRPPRPPVEHYQDPVSRSGVQRSTVPCTEYLPVPRTHLPLKRCY